MDVRVDHSACLAEVIYLTDFPLSEAVARLCQALLDTPFAPGYDWLIDISAITSDVPERDILAVARGWNDLAKGRDVGRRTAVVCDYALVKRMKDNLVNAMPFRAVEIFANRDGAIDWLRATQVENAPHVQFI